MSQQPLQDPPKLSPPVVFFLGGLFSIFLGFRGRIGGEYIITIPEGSERFWIALGVMFIALAIYFLINPKNHYWLSVPIGLGIAFLLVPVTHVPPANTSLTPLPSDIATLTASITATTQSVTTQISTPQIEITAVIPSPTILSGPTLTPTTSADEATCGNGRVKVENLIVREVPGVTQQSVYLLPNGTVVDIICGSEMRASGLFWVRIRARLSNGIVIRGWVPGQDIH